MLSLDVCFSVHEIFVCNLLFFIQDSLDDPPTNVQTARAANYIYALLSFRKMVHKQKLKPVILSVLLKVHLLSGYARIVLRWFPA